MGDACFEKEVECINGEKSYKVVMEADVRYCCFICRGSRQRCSINMLRKTPVCFKNTILKNIGKQLLLHLVKNIH